jgi:hypothetical protein
MLEVAQDVVGDRAGGGFRGSRFGLEDLQAVRSAMGRRGGDRREIFPLIGYLSQHPPGGIGSLAALHASLGGEGRPSHGTIRSLWNLFLGAADRRLQRLYRDYLRDNPPPAGSGHEARIAHLAGARGEAQSIVDGYDWDWLAGWLDLARIGESAESSVAKLSNFGFAVATVNFRFTYHCNIACRHCYNSSGPGRKSERIALDRMLAIVAQMPEAGLSRLILTGGEPFLYVEDVLALIRAARAADVRRISINSNAFWASTEDRARRMLERLADAGFMQSRQDNLKISSGIYHTEFVDLDRIFNLARAHYATFGRPLMVDFEFDAGATEKRDEAMERFRAAGVLDWVDLQFRTVSPLGRGKDLDVIPSTDCSAPCNIIDQVVFDPDSLVRPCCGLNNENHGVVVGQLERPLKDLVKRVQNDPVLQFMASNPMDAIFGHLDMAAKPEGYAGICDLCQHAVGDMRDKEPLQARLFAEQRFYPFWFNRAA